MKYLILFYFILFISIITIINVNSAKKQQSNGTKSTPKNPRYKWKNMTSPLNGPFVTGLGQKGVQYYNQNHTSDPVTFVNVTRGLKRGRKDKGTRRLKLVIFVTKNSSSTGSKGNLACQRLRVIFNVTAKGNQTAIRSKLFNKTEKGECIIPQNSKKNNQSQNKKNK
ncbi:Hypothetical protein SRAE_2000499000 [Strongyloides ratti]|uniref:Uncharacterized protein n=1 Tax=Strongyloides ratti TaxID=34506 RepID=A0A090LKK9_STRRB|nr:Hypothetical protein SRAE_2000499000 [Strongyloides ratti]CEF70357.2 Hypothetical protein SRAE_2000499000 [Strongyloides ratti]